jgi:predicted DNA-binding transcriptional regulator AlpA
MLSIKQDKLNKLIKDDKNFPRPIKDGASRQAAVYFDVDQIQNWWEQQLKLVA